MIGENKKNYSEMPETELNIDDNYLNIFEDELNSLFGKNLNEKNKISQNNFINSENYVIDKLIKDNNKTQLFISDEKIKNKKNNKINKIQNKEIINKYTNKNRDIITSKEQKDKKNIVINNKDNLLNNINLGNSELENLRQNELLVKDQKIHSKKPIFKNNTNILKSNINIAKKFFKEIKNDKTEELKKELDEVIRSNNVKEKDILNHKKNIKSDEKDIKLDEKDILAIKMLIKYLNN